MVIFSCRKNTFAGNPDSSKPIIFEVKCCKHCIKYMAIYVSVIIYSLKGVAYAKAM